MPAGPLAHPRAGALSTFSHRPGADGSHSPRPNHAAPFVEWQRRRNAQTTVPLVAEPTWPRCATRWPLPPVLPGATELSQDVGATRSVGGCRLRSTLDVESSGKRRCSPLAAAVASPHDHSPFISGRRRRWWLSRAVRGRVPAVPAAGDRGVSRARPAVRGRCAAAGGAGTLPAPRPRTPG
jgi:hypothetical protein